jgi:uncharacterized membrane protein YtjA (UPF0391 family)
LGEHAVLHGVAQAKPYAKLIVVTASISFAWGGIMLRWALIFLVISLIAALFGFTGISVAAAGIAKILFFIFVVITVIFLVLAISAGRALRG